MQPGVAPARGYGNDLGMGNAMARELHKDPRGECHMRASRHHAHLVAFACDGPLVRIATPRVAGGRVSWDELIQRRAARVPLAGDARLVDVVLVPVVGLAVPRRLRADTSHDRY